MRHLGALLLLVLLAAVPLAAQRVDSTQTHVRVWVLDEVVTDAQSGRKMPAHAKGKLAFIAIYAPGENPTRCLVEYVALKNSDLDDVRAARDRDKDKADTDRAKVRVFEKGRTKRSDFEAAARAAGFTNLDLDRFFVRVP